MDLFGKKSTKWYVHGGRLGEFFRVIIIVHMGVSKNRVLSPQKHPLKNRVFHFLETIHFGGTHPYFWISIHIATWSHPVGMAVEASNRFASDGLGSTKAWHEG